MMLSKDLRGSKIIPTLPQAASAEMHYSGTDWTEGSRQRKAPPHLYNR